MFNYNYNYTTPSKVNQFKKNKSCVQVHCQQPQSTLINQSINQLINLYLYQVKNPYHLNLKNSKK